MRHRVERVERERRRGARLTAHGAQRKAGAVIGDQETLMDKAYKIDKALVC